MQSNKLVFSLVSVTALAASLMAAACSSTNEPTLAPGDSGGTSNSGGSAGATTTGGSAGTAGTGGTGAAGTAGTAGNPGGAGMAGSGNGLPAVGCDYTTTLGKSCAIGGCHSSKDHAAGLDLTPDANLRQRIVNVAPTYKEIDCGTNGVYMECNPPPTSCPTGAKIVDTSSADASWVIKKLEGTQGTCGETMPEPPGDSATRGWGPDAKTCLETFFRALAAGK